jgi:hypothetical protein
VGLGRGKLAPNWASSDDGCPSQSDGCPLILVEQNRHPGELATLVPSFSILTSSLSLPPRHTERLDLLASDYREEKKRSPQRRWDPSLACTPTVGWTRHHRVASRRRLFALARTDEVASAINLGGLVPEHTSASGGRGVLLLPRRRRFEQRRHGARAHRRRLGLFPHDGGGYTVGRNLVSSTKP